MNLPKGHGLLSKHDAVERRSGRSDARSINAHGVEHLGIHDVEAAASSISSLVSHFMPMIGSTTSGYLPSCGMLSRWSVRSKEGRCGWLSRIDLTTRELLAALGVIGC